MKFKVSGICSLSVGEICVEAKDGIIDLPDEFEADTAVGAGHESVAYVGHGNCPGKGEGAGW